MLEPITHYPCSSKLWQTGKKSLSDGHGMQTLALQSLGKTDGERKKNKDFSTHCPGAGEACPAQATPGKSCMCPSGGHCITDRHHYAQPEVAGAEDEEAALLINMLDSCLCPIWTQKGLPYWRENESSQSYQTNRLKTSDLTWPVRIWEKMRREAGCD